MEPLTDEAGESIRDPDTSVSQKPPRLLLTVEEAAELIGICRSNMFKLIRRGEVESVCIGRLRRITPAAVEDYVRRLSSAANPAA